MDISLCIGKQTTTVGISYLLNYWNGQNFVNVPFQPDHIICPKECCHAILMQQQEMVYSVYTMS